MIPRKIRFAAAYLRVSTKRQAEKDLSIPAQRREIAQFAKTHGFALVEEYRDEGVSGAHQFRPGFQQMLADARRAKFDAIICWDIKRFGRSEFDSATKRELREAGIDVLYVADNIGDGDSAYFAEGMMEVWARHQLRELSKSVRRGQVEAVRQGRHGVPGIAPFGYRVVYKTIGDGSKGRRTLEIKADEAFYVRSAFERYASGEESIRSLCIWLTRSGAQTYAVRKGKNPRGSTHGTWLHQTVAKMLKNPVYQGDLVYGRRITSKRVQGKRRDKYTAPEDWVIYENFHKGIVSRELFQKVQERLSTNKQTKPIKAHPDNFLRNVGRCAGCGGGLSYESNGARYRRYYFACRNKRRLKIGTEKCTGAVPAIMLLEQVTEYLRQTYGSPATTTLLRKAASFNKEAQRGESPEVQALNAQLEELNGRIQKLVIAIEECEGSLKPVASRLQDLEEQRHRVEVRLREVRAHDKAARQTIDLEKFETNIEDLKSLVRRGRVKALAKLVPALVGVVVVDLSSWKKFKETAPEHGLLNIVPKYDLQGVLNSGPARRLAYFLEIDDIVLKYCGSATRNHRASHRGRAST